MSYVVTMSIRQFVCILVLPTKSFVGFSWNSVQKSFKNDADQT